MLTYPLVWHLASAIPHDLGDPLLSTTFLWWNGLSFWPAPGTIALSDHRLGESLIATPLQWAGLNAVAASNLTLRATFPLSAIAAHWLAFTITRRHDAAILCGLAYGFSPYRVAHLQHLELLGGFGMPAALAAIGAACAAAVAVLLPVVVGYERIHEWYGLQRTLPEILQLSADVTGLGVASPLSTLWGWTARWARPEGALFPGLTITALALTGAALGWMRESVARDRIDRWTVWLPVAAAGCAAIAIAVWTAAPWHVDLRGL